MPVSCPNHAGSRRILSQRGVSRWLGVALTCASFSSVAGAEPAEPGTVAVEASSDSNASQASEGVEARKFVQNKQTALHHAVKGAKDPKTDPTVLAIFEQMLDYAAITRQSLGSEWQSLNEKQQQDFADLLQQLVQKSYRKNLRDPAEYTVQYIGEADAAQGTLVKTRAQKKGNKRDKPLAIDYVVGSTANELKIRDIITDGVSLVSNYRSQFKRIIKKKGVEGLLEQMRKQLDK